MNKTSFFLVLFFAFVIGSCKTGDKELSFAPTASNVISDSRTTTITVEKQETNYGILTPAEVTVIFERLNIPYDTKVLNPTTSQDYYLSNSQAALNTGVYGVDFGYLKLFGIGQEAVGYMLTIKDLSNKLGIPDNLFTEPIKNVQANMNDVDIITDLMKTAFTDIESHLKESDRESTAGLIVLGGWIEAMYIATSLSYNPENPDIEIVQRIAEQKYSLTSLLSFLKNYYDDPVVVFYTKKLKYLKNYFDQFELYFDHSDLEIDTEKQVLRSSGVTMSITSEQLDNICNYIAKLRSEIISK